MSTYTPPSSSHESHCSRADKQSTDVLSAHPLSIISLHVRSHRSINLFSFHHHCPNFVVLAINPLLSRRRSSGCQPFVTKLERRCCSCSFRAPFFVVSAISGTLRFGVHCHNSSHLVSLPNPPALLPIRSRTRDSTLIPFLVSTNHHHAILDADITGAVASKGDGAKVEKGLLHTTHSCRGYRLGSDARDPTSRIKSGHVACDVTLGKQ